MRADRDGDEDQKVLLDDRYGPPIPPDLTVIPEKAVLYAMDPYFWEGWEDLVAVAGDDASRVLHRHSFVLVRPEAIAARSVARVLDWLPRQGFALVDTTVVAVDRHQVRALWQYQWNVALRERKDACDVLMTACPSLLLTIRSLDDVHEPATRRFRRLKGPAEPASCQPHQLRAELGHKSKMLCFIHAPDEQADLAREVAILLREDDRLSLYAAMCSGGASSAGDAMRLAEHLYEGTPEHSLDLGASVDRLEAAARVRLDEADPDWPALARTFERIRRGERTDWRELFSVLDARGVACDEWDRITVAGHVIAMNVDGLRVLIPTASQT